MKKMLIAILTLSLLFSVSCGSSKKESGAAPNNSSSINISNTKGEAAQDNSTEVNQKQGDNQKVIYNCDLTIVAEDLSKLSKEVNFKVSEFKGHIQSEEIMERSSLLSVRIPSSRFNDFIAYVESISKLKNKRISTQNVTEAYIDNESRLKNLNAQENQILEIYKRANTVEDVLKVQNELFRIRGEIETLEGRKKLWDNQIEYATVVINAEKLQTITNSPIGVISTKEFYKSIKNGFINSTFWIILSLQKIIIFLLSNIIYIAILAAAACFIYKNKNKIIKK